MVSKNVLRAIQIVAIIFLLPLTVFSTNYYISNSGSNNNSGLEPNKAWQTISHLNNSFSLVKPGDSILFKRGGVFFGGIHVTAQGAQGNPIVFSAYGEGSNPVITGFTVINGWVKNEKNIWEAPAPAVKPNLNMVTVNGLPQRIGRYPNADAPDGGNLRYETFEGKISITDNELNNAINWAGAEVVIRKNLWAAERCRVTKQQGNTITYTNASTGINPSPMLNMYEGSKGNTYFFQKDYRTLDQQGEWFFDSTLKKLQMVLADTGVIVKASVVDTLVNTGNLSFINFSNLSFEGANMSALFNTGGGHITVQYCSFNNIGAKAVHFLNTGDVLIDNVQTNNVLSNAIQVFNLKKDNAVVTGCVIKNTGMFMGMGSFFDDRDYKGIFVMVGNNAIIENNIVENTGLSGIQFQGSNVLVQHNFINHFCLVLHDGAGIYTYLGGSKEKPRTVYTNRAVKENFIFDGGGGIGTYSGRGKAEGVYTDGGSVNIDITGNTISGISNKAFATNNAFNIKINNNTCYDNGGGWGAARVNTWQKFGGLEVQGNIFYSLHSNQNSVNFLYTALDTPGKLTIWEAMKLSGDFDNNYYNTINPFGFIYGYSVSEKQTFINPSPLTFEHWQEYANQDVHSKKPAKNLPLFTLKQKKGNNLVANGTFETGKDGIMLYGTGVKAEWDDTGKITGEGSLKIECTDPQPNRFALLHSPVGILQQEKKYLLSFKTAGTSDCGIVRAYLRKTESPYTVLSVVQRQPFGVDKKNHEFLLKPNADGNSSFVIEIEKNSCTAYIDDIEMHEADGEEVNIKEYTRLEYNATNKAIVIPLDKNYVGVDGTKYNGTITLPPYSSKILIEDISF